MNTEEQIREYLEFLREYGIPGGGSGALKFITDYDELVSYARGHNARLGLIYRSEYNIFAVDLMENENGERFACERIVKTHRGNAVVIVPMLGSRYVLLRQYRPAPGEEQLCFPRGYGEPGISIEDNVRKELREELHADAADITLIGRVIADSGLCGEKVNVAVCRIDDLAADGVYEGIREAVTMTEAELTAAVAAGGITDGFTLSALALLAARRAAGCPGGKDPRLT